MVAFHGLVVGWRDFNCLLAAAKACVIGFFVVYFGNFLNNLESDF